MKNRLFNKTAFVFAVLFATATFIWSAPASSAVTDNNISMEQAKAASDGIFLAKGKAKAAADDNPLMRKNKGRVGHPQPHGLKDDTASDDNLLAKGKRLRDDNPKPHGPGHKLIENTTASREFTLAKAKKARRFDDNPRPHGPNHG